MIGDAKDLRHPWQDTPRLCDLLKDEAPVLLKEWESYMNSLSALDAPAASSTILLFRKKVAAAREQSIETLWTSDNVHDRHARSTMVAAWWKSVVVDALALRGVTYIS